MTENKETTNQKLLSLIVPTYNMASLLPRCLESLVSAPSASDYLEVVVVNDGSTDESLSIAQRWQEQYPNIIRVIDKKNGNYGSTVNAALPKVQGLYVKIVDSDDSMHTEMLEAFLQQLHVLAEGGDCPDMIHTPFVSIGPDDVREVIRYNTMGQEPYAYGRIYSLDEVLAGGYIRFFLIHALTYRTELLRAMDYRQTEGISYTDTEWSCYPTYWAKTILFLNLKLYLYNADREGQTMNPKVLLRSINQLTLLNDKMLDYYKAHIGDPTLSDVRRKWLKQYFENRMRILYKLYLLDMPRADFKTEEMVAFDQRYWPICQALDFHFILWPENKLLRIDYIQYWHKHHKRWPKWFESLNHQVDRLAKFVYVRVFRK
ncbi:MAG: glycosyltransferase family 2 protein [Bacteroidales bacterium]|nr:glycosyltransferase family 2 protein [Bacteroidales bacterium]